MNGNEQNPAGDLLIQEVDEDLRRDQYLRLWRLYGKYAIAGALAIVLGVAGHALWQNWRDQQFQAAAAAYSAAEDLLAGGQTDQGLKKLDAIAGGKSDGFAALAGFRRAQWQSESGDLDGALASYDALSHAAVPTELRDLATLKYALLALDKGDPESLAKRLQPLTDSANPWRASAKELLALLADRRGDKAAAITYYKQLADDAEAPQDLRARAAEMVALLGGTPPTKADKG